ncbi:hypothetical protein [Streptomyces sp. NPDC004100]
MTEGILTETRGHQSGAADKAPIADSKDTHDGTDLPEQAVTLTVSLIPEIHWLWFAFFSIRTHL